LFRLLPSPRQADGINFAAIHPVMAVHLSKMQCLRLFPEVSCFTRIEQSATSASSSNNGVNEEDAGSTATATAWESHKREQRVYMRLVHALLSDRTWKGCIAACIGASSTDNFPEEGIQNTLVPGDHMNDMESYWSSGGQEGPGVPEFLVYKLCSDLCLIDEIRIQPFRGLCHRIYFLLYVTNICA